MTNTHAVLDLLASCLVYSIFVIVIDIILLFVVYEELSQILFYLSLILLAEGGLGLIAGGFIGMNSPIINRIEDYFFRVKVQKPKDKKEPEKHARILIMTGLFLIIIALLVSVL